MTNGHDGPGAVKATPSHRAASCDDRRTRRLPTLLGVGAVALVGAALVFVAYSAVLGNRLEQLRRTSRQRLDFLATVIDQAMQKYESMPYVLSQQQELRALLQHPDEAGRVRSVNAYLQRVRDKTEPLAIYLLDSQGKALASSNWNEAGSFVGEDYSFRPYFLDATRGQPGRFYGVGTTTGEPGYFLSYPMFSKDVDPSTGGTATPSPIGVVVVKISLHGLEQAWGQDAGEVALAAEEGVIFLSSESDWRYRALAPLSAATRHRLQQTRQYGDAALQSLPMQASRAAWGSETASQAVHAGLVRFAGRADAFPLLMQSTRVGPLSWQLVLFSETGVAFTAARSAAVATGLAWALATVLATMLWLRRGRLAERRAATVALQRMSQELEARIAERTRTLVDANTTMQARLGELRAAQRVLRATQDDAIQAGKLAVLGQMSAGIAHEMAQPLTAIRILSENASKLMRVGAFGEASENMVEIADLCRKAGAIVGQLKGFAQKSGETREPVLLDQVISSAATLVRREGKNAGVAFDVQQTTEPIWVSGNSVRLEQVLVNLLRNAIDAMEGSAHPRIRIGIERVEGQVVVRVRDGGSGICAEALDRLFEPFFTTKAPGGGLGLGLAISASIVQAMHGELRAANHADGGAEFTLKLPLASAPP